MGQPTLDVHTEFVASMTALQALAGALIAAYPKAANGFVLDRVMGATGVITDQSIPAANLSSVNAALSAWLATIA